MSRRRKALPPPPAGVDPQTRQWMESVQEQLEVGQGVRGSNLDQFVAFGDILDIGLAQFRSAAKARFGANDLIPSNQTPNRAIPPAPEGVQGVAVIGVNTIIWSDPYARYSNHSHAEVWRAEGAGALLGAAVKIGTAEGTIYSDYTPAEGIVYVYWVRFVSDGSINGPFHASVGVELTTMTRAATIIEDLSGQIDESFLTIELNQRINLIDTAGTGILDRLGVTEDSLYNETTGIFALHASLEDVVTDPVTGLPAKVSQVDFNSLSTFVTNPTTGLSARTLDVDFTAYQSDVTDALAAKASASAFSTLEAAVNDANTGLAAKAAITSLENVSSTIGVNPVTGAIVAGGRAESIDQISLELDDGSGGSRLAAIETVQTVHGDALDGLVASYVLKLDVDGYVSGFGLYNDGGTSDFTIAADRFSIAPPGSIGQVKPFIIDSGVVYMNMAVIKDAAIDQAKIGPISTGKLRLPDGTPITTVAGLILANAIDVDNLQVDWANIINAVIDYAEITGTKPAADADNTQEAVNNTIVMTQGAIRAGKTSANSTTPGYYVGFDGSTPELHVGNASSRLHWDGASLVVRGDVEATSLTANTVDTVNLISNAVVRHATVVVGSNINTLLGNTIYYSPILSVTVSDFTDQTTPVYLLVVDGGGKNDLGNGDNGNIIVNVEHRFNSGSWVLMRTYNVRQTNSSGTANDAEVYLSDSYAIDLAGKTGTLEIRVSWEATGDNTFAYGFGRITGMGAKR